jgi:predicted nuclease of predicted toxin-antitoxin system
VNELFIKLYLDEDVDVFIAELLGAQNFQAISTDEVGRKGKSHLEQLEYTVSENYTILTHNRVDFEELAQDYFSII